MSQAQANKRRPRLSRGIAAIDQLAKPSSADALNNVNQRLPTTGQALQVIEGERKAAQYLARLRAQPADTDELACIVSMLYGARLRGFCRIVQSALSERPEQSP